MLDTLMILVAIGSNLPHPEIGPPLAVCEAAVAAIAAGDCVVFDRSRWFRSAPVPVSDQPDYINGVVSVETEMAPTELMIYLHRIERRFARQRSVPNAARTLDLDLLTFGEIVNEGPVSPILPHPRMTGRAFVLLPMADIVDNWRHPVTGISLETLIDGLDRDQNCVPVDESRDGQGV
tara:strand:+ start:26963 stop:27496 length:534 start_codon:yes stop_codon:yes gene_type:complete